MPATQWAVKEDHRGPRASFSASPSHLRARGRPFEDPAHEPAAKSRTGKGRPGVFLPAGSVFRLSVSPSPDGANDDFPGLGTRTFQRAIQRRNLLAAETAACEL